MSASTPSAFRGGGIGYRRRYRAALLESAEPDRRPDLLEVMPEHFLAAPGALAALVDRYPCVFHGVSLSIGTAVTAPLGDDVTRATLERLVPMVRAARPTYVSEHLAFTRSPSGTDLGHLCPLPTTDEALTLVADRVKAWQEILDAPLALENIAHPFIWPGMEMSEPEFFHRLVDRTGCGMVLDLTNLLYDARNFGFDACLEMERYPLHAVWGVHLAGGGRGSDGFWVDSHSQPFDEDCLPLLRALRGRAPLQNIIVERDRDLPDVAALVAEARTAAQAFLGER